MNTYSKRDESGFTLLELLIVTVMSSLVLMAALEFTTFQQYKSAELSRRIEYQTNIMVALQQIRQDILAAGFGALDLPFNNSGSVPQNLANDVGLAKLEAGIDGGLPYNKSLGAVWTLTPGSDELILGSTKFGRGAVVHRYSHVVSTPTASSVVVAHYDGDPFQPGDSVIFFSPDRSAFPALQLPQIFLLTAVIQNPFNANLYTLQLGLPMLTRPPVGSDVFGVVPNVSGEKIYKVQYAVVDSNSNVPGEAPKGELRRVRFTAGASVYGSNTFEAIPILDNVIDFQIQFLVFPCVQGALVPVWMDDPDRTEFADLTKYPTPKSRMHNRRTRIRLVRVTLLVEAERKIMSGSGNVHLPPGVTSLQVQNHVVSGLNPDKEYILREEIFDPFNFRVRDGAEVVVDAITNAASMNTSLNNCIVLGVAP